VVADVFGCALVCFGDDLGCGGVFAGLRVSAGDVDEVAGLTFAGGDCLGVDALGAADGEVSVAHLYGGADAEDRDVGGTELGLVVVPVAAVAFGGPGGVGESLLNFGAFDILDDWTKLLWLDYYDAIDRVLSGEIMESTSVGALMKAEVLTAAGRLGSTFHLAFASPSKGPLPLQLIPKSPIAGAAPCRPTTGATDSDQGPPCQSSRAKQPVE
jgi:hypothetical protein